MLFLEPMATIAQQPPWIAIFSGMEQPLYTQQKSDMTNIHEYKTERAKP